MTNPDLPPLVNLQLLDVNETALVDAIIAAVKQRVPDWNPDESDPGVVFAQGYAVAAGLLSFTLNQLPGVVLGGLVSLFGIDRKPAVAATGELELRLPSTTLSTKALPKHTRFRVAASASATVDVWTVNAVQINPSDGLTHVIPVEAVIPGALANNVPVNTPAMPVDVVAWVESVRVSEALTGGANAEVDDLFYGRAAAALRRRTDTLVVAEHFQTAALDVPGVGRARAVDLWDGSGAAGSDTGHISIAVANESGGPCTSDVKTAVQSVLSSAAIAGLNVHVVDPDFQPFGLSVTLTAAPGASPVDVDAAVTAYLEDMLSPAKWPWGTRLWVNDVIARVGNLPGVQRVTAVSGAAVTLTSPSVLMLPEAPITVTVTVT